MWLRNQTSSSCGIGVGRFRILPGGGGGGGQGLEYWRGRGQIPSRHMTSSRCRCDVTTSHRRHFDVMCPLGFVINQCQIITFLISKSDIIENSRIELRGIMLPVPSNQFKVTFIIFLPFNLVHL